MRAPKQLFAFPLLLAFVACASESEPAADLSQPGSSGGVVAGMGTVPGGAAPSAGAGSSTPVAAGGVSPGAAGPSGMDVSGAGAGGDVMPSAEPDVTAEPGGTATPEGVGAEQTDGAGGATPAEPGPAEEVGTDMGPDENGGEGGASADPGAGGMSGAGGSEDMGVGGDQGTDEGAGGDDGGGESDADVVPSAGCGKSGRPNGGKVYKAGESWLVFPEAYDGNTPMPVLWGWHGCGSYNFGDANRTEYWDETRNSPFEDEYVIAIPLAASADCFNYDVDIVRTKQLYDELTENYCVDLNHMFGTGHSSGANFLHRMLTTAHKADWDYLGLRGIAPVASGPVNDHTSQVPVMYIHSPGEDVNPEGPAGNFRTANGCSMDSMPYTVGACNSKDDGAPVNANCVSYNDCDVTTIFCPHDDSSYSGTFHGIPCFFYQGAYDFFEGL